MSKGEQGGERPSLGKEIRSVLCPPAPHFFSLCIAHAWSAHVPLPLSHLYEAHAHLGTHQCKLASTKPGAQLALETGRGQVPPAQGWAELFPGNLPEELSSCLSACGLAQVAQGQGLPGQG